jgi:hypothetical protein
MHRDAAIQIVSAHFPRRNAIKGIGLEQSSVHD